MVKISDYITKDLIVVLDVATRKETIDALVDTLDAAGKLEDKKAFSDAIHVREDSVSTAVGRGIAIPHAKLQEYGSFFIAIGIIKEGVDWHALDGKDVTIVFMVGGPDDKQADYLQILSKITFAVKDKKIRKAMMEESPEDIINLFAAQEE
ncbi:MAG: PTS sugar transporter subunit IIA [Waddliaceae bacterium]|nr:PTS sugar transporter subunit IIA [Waddliaceae bacterium]MBT3579426.1 PTS sugar transporter subunit IIA [Waddliaceae bacterium]MBT4445179.1 PTS sugar transporter subunit IIA [Waddliaceae bacterium]MBT6928156.1 PTS sugar transporter subunit IIA [Waddliaceae bacterium]MBT7264489.1 PTS sugar transporter subunit IIA [Waddliaceae bacterium]